MLTPPVLEASVREHRAIAAAILARDPPPRRRVCAPIWNAPPRSRSQDEPPAQWSRARTARRRRLAPSARAAPFDASLGRSRQLGFRTVFVARARSLDCAPSCLIVRGVAARCCRLVLGAASRFGRFCEASVDDDGLALHRRSPARFRLRRRRTLSAEASARATHVGSLARDDRGGHRTHLAAARARARNPDRLGLQLLLDAEIGNGDLSPPARCSSTWRSPNTVRRQRRRAPR